MLDYIHGVSAGFILFAIVATVLNSWEAAASFAFISIAIHAGIIAWKVTNP